MAQTAKLTGHLAQRDEVIGRVITNMAVVMETTAAHREDLAVLIRELGKLTHGLAGDRQQIGTALDSMSQLSIAMEDLVRRTRKPLTADIGQMNTLGGLVNKQTDILTKGLHGAPQLLDAYARSMSYGSWLNTYICSLSIRIARRPHPRRQQRRRQHEGLPVRSLTHDPAPWSTSPSRWCWSPGRLEAAARHDDLHRRLRQRLGHRHGRRGARRRHRRSARSTGVSLERGVVHVEFTAKKDVGGHPQRPGPRSSSPRSSGSTTSTSSRARGSPLDGGGTIPLEQTKSAYTLDKFQVDANDAAQTIDENALATAVNV